MKRCLFLLIFLVLAHTAVRGAMGPPPADGILDPLEVWPAGARKNLNTLRSNVLRDRGFSIFFVAIGAPESMSADRMAQEILTEWLPAGEGVVLLALVDRPGLGMAITTGKKSPVEEDLEEVRMYLYSNRKTDASATVLEAAANQLVAGLRGGSDHGSSVSQSEGGGFTIPYLYEGLSILGAIATIALGLYLMSIAKHSNFFGFQKRFPVPQVKPRLGGTNSGGYGVMIDFGSKSSKSAEPSNTEY